MGACACVPQKDKEMITINNFDKVNIPKEYELVKISTYNVNIRNTVNLSNKVDSIINYINESFKNKDTDIICLQGIHDTTSVYTLVKQFKRVTKITKQKFYYSPCFDNIDSESDDDLVMFSRNNSMLFSKKIDNNSKLKLSSKISTQNIIISRYPIVTDIFSELDSAMDINDILGTQTVVGANISIYGNIISVYNITLCKDIKSANLINNDVRSKEMETVTAVVEQNKKTLKADIFDRYFTTDIHFLTGSFNIDNIYTNGVNIEYSEFIQKYRLMDIYRYMHSDDYGYTNTSDERMDYIFFLLTDTVYNNRDNLSKLHDVQSKDELFQFILKIYKIYFLDICVRKDLHINHASVSFPVEAVFMFYKNHH